MSGIHYPVMPEEYVLTVTDRGVQNPHEHADIDDII
jgi:hypothetical protein